MLALDSNNLQAFSTLAFIYYDMNMLEMAKLVGNQAIKKADEIATGKFEEEKIEEAADGKGGKGGKARRKKEKGKEGGEDEGGKLAKEVNVREAGTGVTDDMKKQLAVVYNTLGLVELKKKNISPAIKKFKKAVGLNATFAEARLNLAALSLNNRDYNTAEENFRAVLKLQPKNYEASIGLGVALRGNKKIDEAETQYNSAQQLDPSQRRPATSTSASSTRTTRTARSRCCTRRRTTTGSSSGTRRGTTSESLKREAEKRIKDIDEIYVALDEAAKMQAESEEMQKKAEEQQKEMEEKMKKQEAAEKAAADKAAADKAAAEQGRGWSKAAAKRQGRRRAMAAVDKGAAGGQAAPPRPRLATSRAGRRQGRAAAQEGQEEEVRLAGKRKRPLHGVWRHSLRRGKKSDSFGTTGAFGCLNTQQPGLPAGQGEPNMKKAHHRFRSPRPWSGRPGRVRGRQGGGAGGGGGGAGGRRRRQRAVQGQDGLRLRGRHGRRRPAASRRRARQLPEEGGAFQPHRDS